MITLSRINIATVVAIIFHMVGIVGMMWFKSDLIIKSTPLHLLLMAALIFYTQKLNARFLLFFLLCLIGGYAVEYLGVHTGIIFGNYQYGEVLGPKFREIPIIIGINWFIIMYMCGSCMHMLLENLRRKTDVGVLNPSKSVRLISLVVDGATLAVFMDWLIEPVAIKLDYWQWLGSGDIPFLNYVSWFVVSIAFLAFFHLLRFEKQNKFALNLLLIQAMFFLILRTFL